MGKRACACIAALCLMLVITPLQASAWSNGGYSADPSHPDYGTHDYLAERAMRWLPLNESAFLRDNFAAFLFGTELPDDGSGPEGIGDTVKHHVYYRVNGTLQDNSSAERALEEFGNARANMSLKNYTGAAKRAGVMSHYIADMAAFGHVMGASTDWGAEAHHSDYENNVTADMTSNASARYDGFMVFDGVLDIISPYDAALALARNTTFGNLQRITSCTWMDLFYNWSDPDFVNSTGDSLNLSANILADVLHTLVVFSGYGAQDTAPPSVSITSPLNGTTLNRTIVNVTGTASDDVAVQKVEVSRDGISWNLCSGNTSWSGMLVLLEGAKKIYARATDTSSNVNITNVTVNVSIPDTAPPTISIMYPANGTHLYDQNVTVTGTASDDHGVSSVELSLDGSSWAAANGTASWSGMLRLLLGPNKVLARAMDTSGNRNGTESTVFLEDTLDPVVEIIHPLNGTVLTSRNVTVTGNAWDDSGVVLVEIGTSNITWTNCTGNASWSGSLSLFEGHNIIYARATDTNDNRNYASVEVFVNTTDSVPPRITITSPPDGVQLGNPSVGVSGTASDDRGLFKVELSSDNAIWFLCTGTTSWSGSLLLREGRNTVIARATDTSGNTNVTAILVTIFIPDLLPPTVSIASPADGSVLPAPGLVLSGTAKDDRGLARVEASLDNSSWLLCTGVNPWSCPLILPEGASRIYVKATDVAGNTAVTSVSVSVVIPDTMPPSLLISAPENGYTFKSPDVTVSGTASDDRGMANVELSLNGKEWIACAGTALWKTDLKLREGKNIILVRAIDTSGNNATATLTLNYRPEPRPQPWLPLAIALLILVVVVALVAVAVGARRGRRRRPRDDWHDRDRRRRDGRPGGSGGRGRRGRDGRS